MKRFWIGVAALSVLLVVSLWVTYAIKEIHHPITVTLEAAEDAALAENWQLAEELATDARSQWARHRQFTAAVADHAPMDEIDGLFAQLPVYAQTRQGSGVGAVCARLARLISALEEAHGPTWWNFL